MSEKIPFYIPPSRIVAGSPTYKQDKDNKGRPKENPNWFIALAVPKSDPAGVTAINTIIQTAMNGYAGHQPTMQRIQMSLANGGFAPDLPGAFRWKIEDGDGERRTREGYAGCWIFKLSTTLGVMNCCDSNDQPIDPAIIKTGFYVDGMGNCQVNGLADAAGAATITSGIYLNPVMIRLLGYGKEIHPGPTAAQLFANVPAVLPQGASAQPVAPANKPGFGTPPQAGFGGQPQPQAGYIPPNAPQQGYGNAPATYQAPQAGFGGQPQPQAGYTPPNAPQAGYTQPNAPQAGYTPPNAPQQGYTPPNAPQAGFGGQPQQAQQGYTPPNAPAPQPQAAPGFTQPQGFGAAPGVAQ